MIFTKKDLIYSVILLIIIYMFYNKIENMSNTDIKKMISEEYKIDVDAVRNLSKLANDLTIGNKLTVPGGLQIEGDVTIKNNLKVDKEVNADGPVSFLPKGSIIAWNGKTPPKGWALCDGKNGTPDLRGRFIRMATLDLPKNGNNTWTYHKYTVAKKSGVDHNIDTNQRGVSHAYIQNHQFNEKGGTDWRTPHINEMVKHSHSMNKAGNHSHSLNRTVYKHHRSFKGDNDSQHTLIHNHGSRWVYGTNTTGEHSHTIHNSGNGNGFGTVPPYYVLAYIMKL